MTIDTFFAYCGVYPDGEDASPDKDVVQDLHTKAGGSQSAKS